MPEWMENSSAVSGARRRQNQQEQKAEEDRRNFAKTQAMYYKFGPEAQTKADKILKDFVEFARLHKRDVDQGWLIRPFTDMRRAREGTTVPAVSGIAVDIRAQLRLWTPYSDHDLRLVGWDPNLRLSGVEMLPSFSLIFEEHCDSCAPGNPRIGYGGHEKLLINVLSGFAVMRGWVR